MPNPHKNKIILNTIPATQALLLEGLAGVKAAYSLRRLKATATYAARVRRSSDNAELDIGFKGNATDTAALLAFAGSDSAYLVSWYDQSGNGQHASQGSAGSQPMVVNAGTLVTENGKPSCTYDGVNDYFIVPSSTGYFKFLHDGTTVSQLFSVQRFGAVSDPNAAYTLLCSGNSATHYGVQLLFDDRVSATRNNSLRVSIFRGVSGGTNLNASSSVDNIATPNTFIITANVFDPANATAADRVTHAVNAGTPQKSNTLTLAPATNSASLDFNIGRLGSSGLYMLGAISELVICTGDISAKRTTIINNLNTYYVSY